MVSELQETVVIHKLKADKRRKEKEEPQIRFGGSLKLGCKRCRYKHRIRNCPAFGKRCHKCNEKGHFMKMCAKRINQIAYEEEQEDVLEDSDPEPGLFSSYQVNHLTITPNLFMSESNINIIVNDWIESIDINEHKLNCKIDTGAQSNVISSDILNKITNSNQTLLNKCNVNLTAFGGNRIETLGSIELSVKLGNIVLPNEMFIVVKFHAQTIIGLHTTCKLKLVSCPRVCQITNHSSQKDIHTNHKSQVERTNGVKATGRGNALSCTSQVASEKTSKDSGKLGSRQVVVKENNKDSGESSSKVVSRVRSKDAVERKSSKVVTRLPFEKVKYNRLTNKDARTVDANTLKEISTRGTDNKELRRVIDQYKDVFDNDHVGEVQGCDYDIKVSKECVPVIHACRRVPFATLSKINDELDRMEKLNVIKKVEKPTPWVNSMTIVHKPDGSLRICLDPTDLNKAVMREHVAIPTPEELHTKLIGAKVFSKLDLKDGYWQIKLSDDSSYYTTFNTPKGRYRYTRLPFGLNSSNEVFQKKVSQAFEGLDGVLVLYDDILVYSNTKEEHNIRLAKCLERTRLKGIKLNKVKCKFQMPEVVYLGHVIGADGIKPNPARIQDILDMPNPTDVKGCQRILGMLNYLAKYIPNMSQLTSPIRQLLLKDVRFDWTYEHEKAMENIKRILTSSPVLRYYDVSKPVVLNTDASKDGFGACILQEGRPVGYASRSITAAQRSYSQIEKELAAIVFGAERFYQYLYGKKVIVETDHKPLITIINNPLCKAPARCQRLLLRLQAFDLQPKYVPGKYMYISDMLSRAVRPSVVKTSTLEAETDLMVHTIVRDMGCSAEIERQIANETARDSVLAVVKSLIINGWPDNVKKCPDITKLYFSLRHGLSMFRDMILYNDRIVIPKALQRSFLEKIHVGHQGQERCKSLARKSIFWKGLNSDIENMVRSCEACLLQRPLPPQGKLVSHDIPSRVWEKIGADVFLYQGISYHVVVCYFSKWVEVKRLSFKHPSTNTLIEHFKDLFSVYGIPMELFSDNHLYNSSEFKLFAKSIDLTLSTSSPRYAQSNGLSEICVKTVKNMLKKCHHDGSDYRNGLLQYRNTPLGSDLQSPAFLFFNRYLRTNLPLCDKLLTNSHCDDTKRILQKRQQKSADNYNRTKVDNVKNYVSGQNVVYRNGYDDKTWRSGVILSRHEGSERSYNILNRSGHVIRRNIKFLLPDNTNRKFTVIPQNWPKVPIPIVNKPQELVPEKSPVLRRSARLAEKRAKLSES